MVKSSQDEVATHALTLRSIRRRPCRRSGRWRRPFVCGAPIARHCGRGADGGAGRRVELPQPVRGDGGLRSVRPHRRLPAAAAGAGDGCRPGRGGFGAVLRHPTPPRVILAAGAALAVVAHLVVEAPRLADPAQMRSWRGQIVHSGKWRDLMARLAPHAGPTTTIFPADYHVSHVLRSLYGARVFDDLRVGPPLDVLTGHLRAGTLPGYLRRWPALGRREGDAVLLVDGQGAISTCPAGRSRRRCARAGRAGRRRSSICSTRKPAFRPRRPMRCTVCGAEWERRWRALLDSNQRPAA